MMLAHSKSYFKIIFAGLLFSACSPKLSSVKSSSTGEGILKIMTYNIHHANPPSKSKEGVIDVDAIADLIKKQNPDLVGLQELDKNTKRSGSIDEAAQIALKTGMHFQFFKSIDYDGGDYGIAILSKFPIQTAKKINLPQVTKAEARVLAYITIKIRGIGELTFADTHLDATHDDGNRVVQMKRIEDELAKKSGPIILVGDLNCEPGKEPIRLLDRDFKRSCINGCPFTIPQINPNKTIDYIALKNAAWPVTEHQVIPELYASDHRPVTALFKIK